MKPFSFGLLASVVFSLSVCFSFLRADESPAKVAILPSTDSSTYDLGSDLQKALSKLYRESGNYLPSQSELNLESFTPPEVSRLMVELNVNALSFVLLEQERLSLFLFDKNHPLQFIVSSKTLNNDIESKFKLAFEDLTRLHKEERYQELPGAKNERVASTTKWPKRDPRIADEARVLFRTLSSQTNSSVYVGAQIGMSRFSQQENSSSAVTFGFNGGYEINPRVTVEAGLSASSFLITSLGGRYALPFKEELFKLSVGLDVASVLASITQNSLYGPSNLTEKSPSFRTGSFFVGPGIFFDIPLLGATLRGDLRFYTGSGTIIVGTYGLVYYL
ncbi:MAG: outer membrane beta-barrel protein [Pseudomonadota bacterium]